MTARCDGCGKEAPAEYHNGVWHKPRLWYERTAKDGSSVMACSRECIEKADAQRGESVPILPF